MANPAVFLDRDNTIIEDPGYISDLSAIKLLPGVEQAIKSLGAAGYKIVVVTNQSGVARGLLTEQALEKIHDELRRQLAEKDAYLDAIYYCPYHPEGTVEGYAMESELRKPRPGMLLKAAGEMELDLAASWMIGDSPRDIEAGQRAGCRTIRVRIRQAVPKQAEREDEDVQADFTVRNLVDAARIILRGQERASEGPLDAAREEPSDQDTQLPQVETTSAPAASVPAAVAPATVATPAPAAVAAAPAARAAASSASATPGGGVFPAAMAPDRDIDSMSELELQRHGLKLLRKLVAGPEHFSISKFLAGMLLVLAMLTFGIGTTTAIATGTLDHAVHAALWMLSSLCLSGLAIALYVMNRD